MSVSTSTIRNLLDNLNEAVINKAKSNNRETEDLLRYISNDATYTMSKIDRDKTEVYRHGFCGEACDAVLTSLKESTGQSILSFKKINPNPEHFYLVDKNSNLIIDATYKQFIYRLLIHTNTGKVKDGITQAEISYVDKMPSIFVGTLQELENEIFICLEHINKKLECSSVLSIWKSPANIKEHEVGEVNIEITSAMIDEQQAALSAVFNGEPQPTEGFVNHLLQGIKSIWEALKDTVTSAYQTLFVR